LKLRCRDPSVVLAAQEKRPRPGKAGFGVENFGEGQQALAMAGQA
jgi:hypothetical protein